MDRLIKGLNPRATLTHDIIALYGEWSEAFYAAGFIDPSPATVNEFRKWVHSRQESNVTPLDYEMDMLKEFFIQEDGCDVCNNPSVKQGEMA